MTYEQKGQYITLLCIQHQKGHIDESDMLSIVKSYDSPVIKKFLIDKTGKYYNKRMEEVIIDREKYCNSRSHKGLSGRKKKNHTNTIRKSYGNHTEDENEDVIKDINNKAFNEFWEKYHSITGLPKTDKDPAIKKYKRLTIEEKKKAIDNINRYFNSLSNKNYPHKARTYLEDKLFNNEFTSGHRKPQVAL